MKFVPFAVAFVVAAATPAFAANLVVNGSFETGDFTGFTQFGNTEFSGVDNGIGFGRTPTDGTSEAHFGPVGSLGGIEQTVTTVAGEPYAFSFDLGTDGGNYDAYAVSFDGSPVSSGTNLGTVPYRHYAFIVQGTGNDTISFAFRNDPYYYLLDNVSLAAVPEPATWALMIGGFAMTGLAARRRKTAVAA